MSDAATRSALREVMQKLQPGEIFKLLHEEAQAARHEEEAAKTHPLVGFTLPNEEWLQLREHLLDGGGVTDDACPSKNGKNLTTLVLQAIFDSDQATFWQELPHLVKLWMASRKLITRNGNHVMLSGIGSAVVPTALQTDLSKEETQ